MIKHKKLTECLFYKIKIECFIIFDIFFNVEIVVSIEIEGINND